MTLPLVSVIIPTYNRKKYLQSAIDSVLEQTFQAYELIVVDDGSTDGTEGLVRGKYAGKVIYYYQNNQDRSAARNHGIELAHGKYIAFLDSDDIWLPEKLSLEVLAMETPGHESVVVVCSSVWKINSEGIRIGSSPVGRTIKLSRLKLADFFTGPKIFASPSNMLIRADALKQVGGFDPSIKYGEDWDLIIRLKVIGQFQYIDQPLLEYRVHSAGTQEISTVANIPRYLEDRLKVIKKNAPLLMGAECLLERIKAELYEDTAYRYFAANSIHQGFDYLCRAGAVQRSFVSPLGIYQKIGRWVVAGALERLKSPEEVDEYFTQIFLPVFLEQWPHYLDSSPNKNQLLGWFYHNLAFFFDTSINHPNVHYWIKSIHYHPPLLIKPSSLRVFESIRKTKY